MVDNWSHTTTRVTFSKSPKLTYQETCTLTYIILYIYCLTTKVHLRSVYTVTVYVQSIQSQFTFSLYSHSLHSVYTVTVYVDILSQIQIIIQKLKRKQKSNNEHLTQIWPPNKTRYKLYTVQIHSGLNNWQYRYILRSVYTMGVCPYWQPLSPD